MKNAGRSTAVCVHDSWAVTRSAPKNRALGIDEARLLPRYRQPMTITQPDSGMNYTPTFNGPGMAKSSSAAKAEPGELRGIPVIGQGVGGVSPHTQPEAETIRRFERRKRAA